MNRELVEKWVAALRSGEYKQTTGCLRDIGLYCCIGVSYNIHDKCNWDLDFEEEQYLETETLPRYIEDDYGSNVEVIHPITGTKQRLKYILSDLNDYRNYNFSQIADYIEATLL